MENNLQHVVIKNIVDDMREHNAHGERRLDEHNAHGVREDDNHQAIAVPQVKGNGGGHAQERLRLLKEELEKTRRENELEKLKFEKDQLKSEKENEGLKATVDKMKLENEQLKNNFEMEKLRAEVAMLKTEKQFGLDKKIVLDQNLKLEEELKAVKIEKEKVVEDNKYLRVELLRLKNEKQGLEQQNKNLKEQSDKLQLEKAVMDGKHQTLQNDNQKIENQIRTSQLETAILLKDFEKLSTELKDEKENKKMLQGKLNDLQEAYDRLQEKGRQNNKNDNEQTVLVPVKDKVLEEIDFSHMATQEVLYHGLSMFLESKFCSNYAKWYNAMQLKIAPGKIVCSGNNLIIKKESSPFLRKLGIGSKIAIGNYVHDSREWSYEKLTSRKLLHPKDNTRPISVEYHRGENVWLLDHSPGEEYIFKDVICSYLIFVTKT
eukprot:TCONS_00054454-protein